MISLIEAKNYRCLRYVREETLAFDILVGPNASGKSTFLDVVRFMGDLVSRGFEEAVYDRSDNMRDLIWQKQGDCFELAVEMNIPVELKRMLPKDYNVCRYETSVGIDPDTGENSILAEKVLLKQSIDRANSESRSLFPSSQLPPDTIITPKRGKGKTIVNKVRGGNDNFYDETGKGWDHVFKLGSRKSALASLPEDETKFPVSTWLKKTLIDGAQSLILNSLLMRRPSSPGQPRGFHSDGSNLPWAIEDFKKKDKNKFERWMDHIRTALPEIRTVETVERPEDKHRYLQVIDEKGIKIPSWVLSDGTLRLLALTLVAYIDQPAIYLIEEPENGIHPLAVETVFQALSSAYESQILCASHSPVILSLAEPRQVLCFAKDKEGATDVVRGSEHPYLKDWKGDTDLGTLFAAGVLG